MSEGTKLGEFKESNEFNTAVKQEVNESSELKGTKLGEVSEFEKSLSNDKETTSENKTVVEKNVEIEKEDDSSSLATAVEQVSEPSSDEKVETVQEVVEEETPAKVESNDPEDIFKAAMDESVMDYQEGDIIKGIVRRIEKGGILVDIKYKSDGFIVNSEYSNDPHADPEKEFSAGDEISSSIVKLESKEGYTVLSRKKAEYEIAWNTIISLSKTKDPVDVYVTSAVQGGVVAEYKGIKGFVPASQLLKEHNDPLDGFVNKPLTVTVLQADRKRRKVIFSNKMARRKTSKKELAIIFESIDVGQVKEGKVTSIKDFGVFVDVGGVEGLVHISELSWSRVNHPSEIMAVGDEVKVFVLGVDRENEKISLGIRQLQPDPWVKVAEKYEIGQTVEGTISRILAFGAFMQIEKDLEGLIHISELSYDHVKSVEDVVKSGQTVKARIIKLLPDEQKIGLSLKGVNDEDSSSDGSESQVEEQESVSIS
ncbi:S1 RNA-binding domain-containing protein [bacterium]|jgi:small subunit ribosomal protein S1|nr:S1 RNA-binding domain-containing protein [bacterium]